MTEHIEPAYLSIAHFSVEYIDGTGKTIILKEPHIRSVEFGKYQDVLDLLPYLELEGKLLVGMVGAKRPALALRSEVVPLILEAPDLDPDCYWESPSHYIREDEGANLEVAIDKVLGEKMPGVKRVGPIEILGGSYLPSVGGSTEMAFPRAVRVSLPQEYKTSTSVRFVDVQELIDGYLSGRYADVRLVELAFRLAQRKNYPVSVTFPRLSRSTERRPLGNLSARSKDRKTVRKLAATTHSEEGVIAHIRVTPVDLRKKAFLSVRQSGKKEFVVREGVDAVDVGCYFWHEGKLFMPVKRGIRFALAVRNLRAHPIHTDSSPVFIEGVAGSLEGERDLEAIRAHGIREVAEEVGLLPVGEAVFVAADYPSPGRNLERVYRFLLEVDPTKEVSVRQPIDETVDVWYLDVDDILLLADEGVIRDPRLTLNAHLLKSAFRYVSPDVAKPKGSAEELEAFEQLLNSGSRIAAWLTKEAPEIDRALDAHLLYRRLKSYCENELGVVAIDLAHPEEAHFFSAMVPLFAIPHPDDPRKLPFYFLHDIFHYATGDYLPLTVVDGQPVFHSFEEYRKACSGNESQAVWYSDVVIPNLFGHAQAEAIFGGVSVARAFAELGCNEEDSRRAIRSIELDGIIPDAILFHRDFEKFRGVIIGRLLRYHVMDQVNIRSIYEYWTTHPRAAALAARFCNVFTDRTEYEHYYEQTLKQVAAYTEGSNPLRAALSRTINFYIRLTALRLAHLKELFGAHALRDAKADEREIDRHIELLHVAYTKLGEARKQVDDVDVSAKNLEAFRLLNNVLATTQKNATEFADRLAGDATLFPAAIIAKMKGRLLPYFPGFTPATPEYISAELARIEGENRARRK